MAKKAMLRARTRPRLRSLPLALVATATFCGDQARGQEVEFPVQPELFIDEFQAAEGITFNGEGKLFVAANQAAWVIGPDGSTTRLADLHTNLGQAGIGERDILQADFGLEVALRDGPGDDGIVWRITPEGERTVAATGIGDPNFILVREDGSFLVSDDFTRNIYLVSPEGEVSLWTDSIPYPNGMVFSLDGSVLYVAQLFTSLDPVGFDDRIWALRVEDGRPVGEPWVVGRTGEGGVDGLAMDELGRVYIADNGAGKIWRLDPESGEMILIADGVANVASLVFGEGEFDHESIYAASTFRGGGKIWRVKVGVRGAALHR